MVEPGRARPGEVGSNDPAEGAADSGRLCSGLSVPVPGGCACIVVGFLSGTASQRWLLPTDFIKLGKFLWSTWHLLSGPQGLFHHLSPAWHTVCVSCCLYFRVQFCLGGSPSCQEAQGGAADGWPAGGVWGEASCSVLPAALPPSFLTHTPLHMAAAWRPRVDLLCPSSAGGGWQGRPLSPYFLQPHTVPTSSLLM